MTWDPYRPRDERGRFVKRLPPRNKPLRYAELCAGYGGLGLAVEEAYPGAELAWYSEFEEAPSKIMAAHWPGVPNHGDMTTVDWAAVEPVDLISGGTPCFPAGTLIDTEHGYRPIEDISLGDMVRTHAQQYMPVVQLMNRQAVDTLAVKVMGSPEFVTTEEHPFYVRAKGRIWNNDRRQYDRTWAAPEWVAAKDLDPGKHFVGFQIDAPDESITPLGDPLAYIIGRWLGDGWVRNAKRSSPISKGNRGSRLNSYWWQAFICCAHDEAEDLALAITAAGYKASRVEERTVTKFRIDSQDLVKILLEFGSGAAGKRVPGWVYKLSAGDQRSLWFGWVDSDGSTQASGQVRVTTVSEQLAHGMARVARNAFRRAVSVHHSPMPSTCVIEGRTVNQRDQFHVVLPVGNREAFIEGDWCWVPVRAVKPSEPAKVYNFGVQDDESYTAWGITVHNCQDLSHAGRRRGMTEGTRSNLWVAMREAVATIKPTYVVWENVRGAYSACADSEIDSELGRCPRCVDPKSGADHAPNLRALGRVLGDLSSLGYDAQWRGLRAADVGAPHGRFRVFVLARRRDAPAHARGF